MREGPGSEKAVPPLRPAPSCGQQVVEPFPYLHHAPAPGCVPWHIRDVGDSQSPDAGEELFAPPHPDDSEADLERQLAEASARSFDAGRQKGFDDGQNAERAARQHAHEDALQRLTQQVATLTESFAEARDRYFDRMEPEIVKLALGIAARILRREAQVDPLLLLGAVRVALGQLAAAATLRLRVPAADAGLWSEAVKLLPERNRKPEVYADNELHMGECLLESDLGSADLGLYAQLREIERGFFDRLAPDPGKGAETPGLS